MCTMSGWSGKRSRHKSEREDREWLGRRRPVRGSQNRKGPEGGAREEENKEGTHRPAPAVPGASGAGPGTATQAPQFSRQSGGASTSKSPGQLPGLSDTLPLS